MFLSIRWKIIGIFVIGNFVLGIVLVLLVSRTVEESLQKELIERGRTIGLNLAANCGDLILENDLPGLRHLISSNMNFESLDYILILDSEGKIVGDNFNGQVPKSLQISDISTINNSAHSEMKEIPELHSTVYDIWVPIEEGFIGFVRIGMATAYVQSTVNATIRLIIITILAVTLVGIVPIIFLAERLIRPIIYLTRRADEISSGKLEQAIEVKTGDEIERLAQALERLRESVKIALDRLKKQQSINL